MKAHEISVAHVFLSNVFFRLQQEEKNYLQAGKFYKQTREKSLEHVGKEMI